MPITRQYQTKDGSIKQKTYFHINGQRAESYRRKHNRAYKEKQRQIHPPKQRVYPPSQADILPEDTVNQIMEQYQLGTSLRKLSENTGISRYILTKLIKKYCAHANVWPRDPQSSPSLRTPELIFFSPDALFHKTFFSTKGYHPTNKTTNELRKFRSYNRSERSVVKHKTITSMANANCSQNGPTHICRPRFVAKRAIFILQRRHAGLCRDWRNRREAWLDIKHDFENHTSVAVQIREQTAPLAFQLPSLDHQTSLWRWKSSSDKARIPSRGWKR